MRDIVERMEAGPPLCSGCGEYPGSTISNEYDQAAAEITRLRAKVAKADALVEGLDAIVDAYGCECAAEAQQLATAYREADT